MTGRIPLDSLTGDQLDALYARAAQTEHALAEVRDVIADMEEVTGARTWASWLRAAIERGLGEQPGPAATEATEATHAEAVRQMDADTANPHTGLVVQPYRDHGKRQWVFRCWGTDTCDGWLSLDHFSKESAERARDRHVAEEHTRENPMPTTPCNATITGPNVPDDETLTCTVEDVDRHPANHVGPKREYGHVLWTDHHAGATPHRAPAEEQPS